MLIPTGSLTLNMACSDTALGGYVPGTMVNVVGDSSAGKSFLCLTMLAEVANIPEFDQYTLIYDDAEHASEFDLDHLFGAGMKDRVEIISSANAENFYQHVLQQISSEKPFIYVLDSFDSIHTLEDEDRASQFEKTGKATGSFQTSKPRLASEMFRTINGKLKNSKSLLVVVSQTRDNIGVTFGSKKTRSGGHALRFYSTHEVWLAVKGRIKNAKYAREIGVNVIAKVKKNKLNGKQNRTAEFPIYYDYGVDNVAAGVAFLLANGYWQKQGRKIKAEDFSVEMMETGLISHIEANDLEESLYGLCEDVWMAIEDEISMKDRKRKFE